MYRHLSIKVVPQVSLLQSSFLGSDHGQLGWEKLPGVLKPLLLKACSGIQGAAPHQPKLVLGKPSPPGQGLDPVENS